MFRPHLLAASAFGLLAALTFAAPARADGDAEAGQKTFKTHCGVCHNVAEGKNGVGPSLFGVFGRKASGAPGFKYSKANLDSGLTWDEKTLDTYLTNPREVVKGTIMSYAGMKDPAMRANVIAYLKTVK